MDTQPTKTLLLWTAFVVIACVGMLAWGVEFYSPAITLAARIGNVLHYLAVGAPIWLPFAFLVYCLGCRNLTARILIVFAVSEIVAVAVSWFAILQHFVH